MEQIHNPLDSPPINVFRPPELNLTRARERAETARSNLTRLRMGLELIDDQLRQARARRKYLLESRQLSEDAARASGLIKSPLTRASLERLERQAEAVRRHIHELVGSALPICEEFERAYDELHQARESELHALVVAADFIKAQREEADRAAENLRLAQAEIQRLEAIKRQEDADRERELGWIRDAHYDPKYDDREIAMRRARPWISR